MIGPLAFSSPWILVALAALPVVYWLIRVTPPAPRHVAFPAIRILMGLRPGEEAAARTPPWLMALRLLVAALVVLGLARPLLNPAAPLGAGGPVVLVLDDGWRAAPHWEEMRRRALDLVDRAGRAGRDLLVLTTAPEGTAPVPPRLLRPADARGRLLALAPKPWEGSRAALAATLREGALAGLPLADARVHWLSDGLAEGNGEGDAALAASLSALGPVEMEEPPPAARAMALVPPAADPGPLTIPVVRPEGGIAAGPLETRIVARGGGRILGTAEARFAPGDTRAEARLDLPAEIRNGIEEISLAAQGSAGGTILLDERWRRRPVGLVSGDGAGAAQPLLSDLHYLDRALSPFAEVRTGSIASLLERPLSLLVLADVGQVVGPEREALVRWIEAGGVLVRFAGPRLAAKSDDLVPVPLRAGGRALGGALTWEKPQALAPFPPESPFAGLAVPPDVTISRQVLAEPDPALGERTWARLADGTPLVTADRRGKGRIVLVHTSANAEWSNLVLSGLFVDMMRRLVQMSAGIAGEGGEAPLPPFAVLDGMGRLGAPGPADLPLAPADLASSDSAGTRPGPRHPPGFYGDETARRAFNLARGDIVLSPLPDFAGVTRRVADGAPGERDLMAPLLLAALALVLLDGILGLWLRGLLRGGRAAAAVVLAVSLAAVVPAPARAETMAEAGTAAVVDAVLKVRLAYVVTGDGQADAMSRAGLEGLGAVIAARTAVDMGPPAPVDPARDDLSFYPLIYWPMIPGQQPLSDEGAARIDSYMKGGGTILFDTRDADREAAGGGAGTRVLREVLGRLDVPPLVPAPADHVLTKSFYLLKSFPGRHDGGTVWVEQAATAANDGVSSLVVGGNDWAAAWALDETGRPLAPVGEDARRREWALRFGVNLVMYALTGNYKADQVHVPALLERLGQ